MKTLLCICITITLAGCFGKEPEKTGHEGESLPSFKIFLQDSTKTIDTKDIPSGQPIVLFYFGPHCPYSKTQMEDILANMNDLKGIRFYVFTTWPLSELKKFNAYYKLQNYPNIVTGIDFKNFFANYYGADGVPYIAIYGKDKRLREAFIGKVESNQIRSVAFD